MKCNYRITHFMSMIAILVMHLTGFALESLWTDLTPTDNKIVIDLISGGVR